MDLVPETSHSGAGASGKVRGRSSRPLYPDGFGFRRLHPKWSSVSTTAGTFPVNFDTGGRVGHVCQSREQEISKIMFQDTSLGSQFSGRPDMSPHRGKLVLCKPPMDHHKSVANKTKETSTHHLHARRPLLGFSIMVAPVSKTACPQDTHIGHQTFPRNVLQLPGRTNAPPKVAPPLHFVIRKILEGRQMSAEAIDLYLKSLGDIRRYQNAFNMFWHQCSLLKDSLTIKCLTLDFVAERLLYLNAVSCSQARSAYAALLMIPGLEQLKFSPLLRKLKQSWNTSQPKYPIFWDMGSVLKKLASSPLDFSDVKQVRDRLILCWRLLGLYRSVDLAQVYRQVSWAGEKPFVLVKRKGWRAPRWEQVMVLEDVHLSPWHLLCQYVKLTCHLPKGSLLLRSLLAPFSPIGPDRVASLTRKLLQDLGVPMDFWGPHSTRGAGVQFFKKLGLTSEQVCEMGPWKNLGAFSTHYLRLGAQEVAGK